MSEEKKYYYLKFQENFYDKPEIKVIEAMQNGYEYTTILLKMYCKSIRRDGKLMLTDKIPYELQTMSAALGHKADVIRAAVEVFEAMALIQKLDDGAIYMMDIQNYIGHSSSLADRKRAYRSKIESEKKQNGQLSSKCPDKCPTDIDIEIEKELNLFRADAQTPAQSAADKFSEKAEILFDYYLEIFKDLGKKPTRTPEKLNKIKARLKKFTIDECRQAIKNCRNDDFLTGLHTGKFYAHIDYIFRNDEKLEKLLLTNQNTKIVKTFTEKEFSEMDKERFKQEVKTAFKNCDIGEAIIRIKKDSGEVTKARIWQELEAMNGK